MNTNTTDTREIAPTNNKPPPLPSMYEVIEEMSDDNGATFVQVLAVNKLAGSSDVRSAERLFFATQTGLKLKMVRIILRNGHIRTEPGSLYFMKGHLEMKASTGGGLLKGLSRKLMSGETFFVNEIHGAGEIWLEPTFGHFLLVKVEKSHGIIVDKGLFYAGTSNLNISAKMQKTISSGAFGGEGWFQTSIDGSGIAVIFSHVPRNEIVEVDLNNEKLSVDGNFAMVRTSGVEFSTQLSSSGLLSTSVSGEGLLQTFTGTGKVWLAPTQSVYEKLVSQNGLAQLAKAGASSGHIVGKK